MAYYQNNPYGAQQGGQYPPQPQQNLPYGHPPPQQFPASAPSYPPQNYQAPYGAPQPQAQYGAPQGPPPGQYGAPQGPPPPGQYGAPQGAPPQQQPAYNYQAAPYGAPQGPPPPQQQYNQSYPGQYGAPPPANPYGAPTQQYAAPGPYGAPQQQPPYSSYPGAPASAPQPYGQPQYGGGGGAYGQQQQPAYIPLPMATGQVMPFYSGAGLPQLSLQEAQRDAEILRKAMKGIGTDEKALISVLPKRNSLQGAQIANAYKSIYGRDLIKDIKSETSGNFERVLVRLCMSLPEVDALEAHDAMFPDQQAGFGTDEDALIEILTGRSNAEIWAIKQAYRGMYGKEIEHAVQSDTSGHFRKILVALLQGNRDETGQYRDVAFDVDALYRAGVGRAGTDESAFIAILASRSEQHLRAVFGEYERKYREPFEKVIKKEFSGDIENALLGLVRSIINRPYHIAHLFEKAMAGMGTKDNKLIRLTVRHRDPAVMQQVKAAYYSQYGRTLYQRVEGETSGDYRKALLAMIGP